MYCQNTGSKQITVVPFLMTFPSINGPTVILKIVTTKNMTFLITIAYDWNLEFLQEFKTRDTRIIFSCDVYE